MFNETSRCDRLVSLDRKVSRAIERGRGLKISTEELDLLAELGLMDQVGKAKADALKQLAIKRRSPPTE